MLTKLIKPDMHLNSLVELKLPEGIEAVVLDLEGVITPRGKICRMPSILAKIKELKREYKVVVLSNLPYLYFNHHELITELIENIYGLPVVASRFFKPARRAFRVSLEYLNINEPSKVAMVGDSYFMDVLGARLAGFGFVVKVKSLKLREIYS